MRKIKFDFLKSDERLSFGRKKGSKIVRYFDNTKFEKNFNLYIDYNIPPIPNNLSVLFIYIDKKNNQFSIKKEFSPKERNFNQYGSLEFKIPVIIKQEDKILYKIAFEINPIKDSFLHISISDL